MASVFRKEGIEMAMAHTNLPFPSTTSQRDATPAGPGRKLLTVVTVSFGLLCVLQAALNISLRFTLYSSDKEAAYNETLKNLTEDRDKLKRKLYDFEEYSQRGWVYFRQNFYYISSIKKTWQDSRDDCLQRGADLMILNSKEEEVFGRKFTKNLWIGLNDTETEGVWKWLDGTPVDKSYWGPGEPNNDYEGRSENCAELRSGAFKGLNDLPCDIKTFWICEKAL
ncbi:hypothetical protein LDENG_00206740 [Lucifuga dentata]|nr:hypothetical protein LDENG_00206740 [Lucifuga dentata]